MATAQLTHGAANGRAAHQHGDGKFCFLCGGKLTCRSKAQDVVIAMSRPLAAYDAPHSAVRLLGGVDSNSVWQAMAHAESPPYSAGLRAAPSYLPHKYWPAMYPPCCPAATGVVICRFR